MRGLFSDNIADQVMGYVICFARNLHVYVRNQASAKWAPVGGEAERVGFAAGPAHVTAIDRAHKGLAGLTLGVVGLGAIGAEVARRALAFSMRVVAIDPVRESAPEGVSALWRPERLPELLGQSDFVVIAAPQLLGGVFPSGILLITVSALVALIVAIGVSASALTHPVPWVAYALALSACWTSHG